MKRKIFKKALLVLLALTAIYWLPFVVIMLRGQANIVNSIDQLPDSDAVIIFGAHITKENEATPLLKERLDGGKVIMETGKAKKIVVSNTKDAANVMAKYLVDKGISSDLIEIDAQADKTPDTCKYEINKHPEKRKLIFVSQGFHLPRLLFQCKKEGVEGIGFSAETLGIIDRSQYPFFARIYTRAVRYAREAGLTWLAFLNIYK